MATKGERTGDRMPGEAGRLVQRNGIDDGQRAGEFREDVSSRDLAQLAIAALEGAILLSRLRKRAAPLESCIETLKVFLGYTGP